MDMHEQRSQYEKGGAKSEDHVEHFLLNCGDDNLMDFIYLNDWVIYIEWNRS